MSGYSQHIQSNHHNNHRDTNHRKDMLGDLVRLHEDDLEGKQIIMAIFTQSEKRGPKIIMVIFTQSKQRRPKVRRVFARLIKCLFHTFNS